MKFLHGLILKVPHPLFQCKERCQDGLSPVGLLGSNGSSWPAESFGGMYLPNTRWNHAVDNDMGKQRKDTNMQITI